ncbi:MAG: hypothetical protein ACMZ66_07965 [Thalassospira sp.]|uniref:hypothetical protein n=1 Tax=Thalassospira sp. TaxID=1912094 RepID=UPI003A8624FE
MMAAINKGQKTEEVLRSYFLRAGFFVVRGVQLRYGGSDLTDIDLWIYERSATLARRRTIIDIKDKQRPQAIERLFFVNGVAKVIGVEGVGIATTDRNPALRELAQKHRVLWIDGDDLKRLKGSSQVQQADRLSEEDLLELIAEVDKQRSGSKELKDRFEEAKSSIGDRFGAPSANLSIESFHFFADAAIKSHPSSPSALVLVRLSLLMAAYAAASLDFASADAALRPLDERIATMANGIRFGASASDTYEKLDWMVNALREYAPQSNNMGLDIKKRILEDIKRVPAEGLAEVTVKLSNTNKLFTIARELEWYAYSKSSPSFDSLPTEAKGFIGALLDFCGHSRKNFAHAAPPKQASDENRFKAEGTRTGRDLAQEKLL